MLFFSFFYSFFLYFSTFHILYFTVMYDIFINIIYGSDLCMKELIVTDKYDGCKVSKFVFDSFPFLPSGTFYKALRQKDIKLNGTRINK